jgi:hypothetical protein
MPDTQESLTPVPVPPLAVLLLTLQERMQRPLTKLEVIIARDNCHCVMMTQQQKLALEDERGYPDVDPNHVWESWQAFLSKRDNQ